MRISIASIGILAGLLSWEAWALDPTDYIMNGGEFEETRGPATWANLIILDSEQSNYLPNHNMDPNVITSDSFGQLWRFAAPRASSGFDEQFFAKPLVYTPTSTGRQLVLAFSEQNKIYALDAVNGTLISSRDLSKTGEPPFLVSDLGGCNDIGELVGITGTPVIDPTSDTVYFWAKSYSSPDQAGKGWMNGNYRFHAVDVVTLQEKPGFPINLQGHPGR